MGETHAFHFPNDPNHKFHESESDETRFVCDGCKEPGVGLRYRCKACNDCQLHKDCLSDKPTKTHDFFSKCSFRLYSRLPDGCKKKYCDGCGKLVKGFVYHCKEKDKELNLHPCCMNLPDEIKADDGVTLKLHDVSLGKCSLCIEGSVSKLRGWSYKSAVHQGENHLHVSCAAQMIQGLKNVGARQAIGIGDAAKYQVAINPTNTVFNSKGFTTATVQNSSLNDVTPHALGVDVNGEMSVVIPKNTRIPTKKERNYKPGIDPGLALMQDSISFKIYKGDNSETKNNSLLGSLTFDIPLLSRIKPADVTVCFGIDAKGILTVSAQDDKTKEMNMTKIANSMDKLSKDDIHKKDEEAEASTSSSITKTVKLPRVQWKKSEASTSSSITETVKLSRVQSKKSKASNSSSITKTVKRPRVQSKKSEASTSSSITKTVKLQGDVTKTLAKRGHGNFWATIGKVALEAIFSALLGFLISLI